MLGAQLRRQQLSRLPIAPWSPRRCRSTLPLVHLERATLYRDYPSDADDSKNAPIVRDLSFSLPPAGQHWAIVSPASTVRTDFLRILKGNYFCSPPTARTYPHLLAKHGYPERSVSYVGFDAEREGLGGIAVKGAYLSARYEAHREVTDWSLMNYLEGKTELNALEMPERAVDTRLLQNIISNLNLRLLLNLPVSNLSNGQTRRARIAKALLAKPELMLLDGPFMGLDPITRRSISHLLMHMAHKSSPRLVMSLRPEDEVPHWITHLLYMNAEMDILANGEKMKVYRDIKTALSDRMDIQTWRNNIKRPLRSSRAKRPDDVLTRDAFPEVDPPLPAGEPLVEMQGVKVSYGAHEKSTRRVVLGNWSQQVDGEEKQGLWWNIHRGERWGVFGPNGSGKTTLLSLITSDHPQTYGLPIKLFGRSRLPEPGEPGISIFELQSRIGHSSPEVHTYFPKHLTVRRVLESAWADTPLTKPLLTHRADRRVDAFLRWFAPELSPTGTSALQEIVASQPQRGRWRRSVEMKRRLDRLSHDSSDLDWADSLTFRDLSFSSQRLVLFLRALVAGPDLVILDEALSGVDEAVRDKCLLFLSQGESTQVAGKHYSGFKFQDTVQKDNDVVVFSGLEDRQALLTISHNKEDLPGCVRQWICLPEASEGLPPRTGSLNGPLEFNPEGWSQIWGLESLASARNTGILSTSKKVERGRGRPRVPNLSLLSED